MTRAYAAILQGNQLEWTGEPPGAIGPGQAIPVTVLVEEPSRAIEPGVDADRWKRAVEAMKRIAERGTFGSLRREPDRAVKVEVKVLDQPESSADRAESSQRIFDALERLAASNPFEEIADSVAWQHEIRKDRPLLGREDE